MVDITDVVTYTNFGDHRLRGFWVAGGQISPSPIDFHSSPLQHSRTAVRACDESMTVSIHGQVWRCTSRMSQAIIHRPSL